MNEEKKNIVDDSFKNLQAGRDIHVNIGDSKKKWGLFTIAGLILIVVVILIIFLNQKPTSSVTNQTFGNNSPVIIDSGGNVNLHFNTDPFADDSLPDDKP